MLVPAPRRRFVDDPVGRYFAGRQSAVFVAAPAVRGCIVWSRPDIEDVASTIALARELCARRPSPHVALLDARRLEALDPIVFPLLVEDAVRGRAERLAIVRPEGLLATVAHGFFSVVTVPYPVRVFTELADALRWLTPEVPSSLALELEELRGALAIRPLLVELRAAVQRRLPHAELDRVAADLGLSVRTLQRRLMELGTTWQKEVAAVRVVAAQIGMLDPEPSRANLTQIAYEVGCSSPAHLSALFRKETGMTPSEWRSRRLRGPAHSHDTLASQGSGG